MLIVHDSWSTDFEASSRVFSVHCKGRGGKVGGIYPSLRVARVKFEPKLHSSHKPSLSQDPTSIFLVFFLFLCLLVVVLFFIMMC